jgi:hypothetical protein
MVPGYARREAATMQPFPSTSSRLLAAAGAVAATGALVVMLVTPLLLKAPGTRNTHLRSVGAATALDPASGRQLSGTFALDTTVTTHGSARSTTVASYDQVSVSTFQSTGHRTRRLASSTLTEAFDRSTGVGRPNVLGDTVGSTAHVFKLPFHTARHDYVIWDDTAKRAVALRFTGERDLDGLRVYVFTRDVPATDLGVLPVFHSIPGSFVGHPELASIPADEWYETARTELYVEPVTGSLVGGMSSPHLWAQTTGRFAGLRVDLLRVSSAAPDDRGQAMLLARARKAKRQVLMVEHAPWVLGGLGVALVATAGLVGRRRPRRAPVMGDSSRGVVAAPA